jgi:hypothetical protein
MSSRISVILLVLGRPERSSSSTDTRLVLKYGCQSKTAIRLKECSPKAPLSISGILVVDLLSFELHTKLDADMLLGFAIRRRQNEIRS